ncbi:DUF4047 domain-containing protein [Gottfriedia acidiceleris]|uniref:DUF4047 domain-containing protein n=1 Tax=Gottfriedia acidiceleris TaxID=371036 RepID=UPI0013EE0847|nr:DUF4047 domain-containing protein [Gottfriedia acidiceleris]
MRRAFHKVILFPCLCCMSFYVGSQIVGETEALFSSQLSPKPITVAAAFVFPATIEELDKRAEDLENQMQGNYESIMANTPDQSLRKLRIRLTEITTIEHKLYQQSNSLQLVYDEMSSYDNRLQDQKMTGNQTFGYVREGFQKVDRIIKEVQDEIDFQKIADIRSSITLQIKDLEEKEKGSRDHLQDTDKTEIPANNQVAEKNSNMEKQVTEIDKENIANSK